MSFDIASFAVGGLIGSILAVAIAIPRAGRVFTRLISVVFMVAGVGLLTWAIVTLATGAEFRAIEWESFRIAEPVEALGVGGGLLAGALLSMALSTRRRQD